MIEIVPNKLKDLAAVTPFTLYLVGGCVRDYLLKRLRRRIDFDICGAADAEVLVQCALRLGFSVKAVYKKTGTVKLFDGEKDYEFTSFRTDNYKRGEHTPFDVEFTDNIMLDAKRRDFKCNAVYYDINNKRFADPLNAFADLQRGIITTTRSAKEVFSEDGLRLMRLARIAAEIQLKPTDECICGARENAALLRDISPERIYSELIKILHSDKAYPNAKGDEHYRGLKILDETRVLDEIFPELTVGRGMPQRADFHQFDVLEHSLRVCLHASTEVRLAALLHDVGKPVCFNNTGKYHEHDFVGGDVARVALTRLRAPNYVIKEVCELIRLHMYDLDLMAGKNKIRLFMVKYHALYDKLCLLKQADYAGCKDINTGVCPTLVKWQPIYDELISQNAPFTVNQLNINGRSLQAMGYADKNLAAALVGILKICILEPKKNTPEQLNEIALRHLKNGAFI